jgi:hypothetical protein
MKCLDERLERESRLLPSASAQSHSQIAIEHQVRRKKEV